MAKCIDLSHVIDPKNAGRKFLLTTIGADEVNPNVVRLENQWYIMHDIAMVSHIGTHIEAPYHVRKDGADMAQMPLEKLYGEAVLLDLRNLPAKSKISEEDIKTAAKAVGGIKDGDIVFCNMGYASFYGKPEYSNCPYFSTEAINWLANSGMKMMGVDASGVEIPGSEQHVNHFALLGRDIPLIENLNNLNALTKSRFTVYAFPAAVATLESFPLRVVAFVEE